MVLLGFGLLGKLVWDLWRPDLPDIGKTPGAANSAVVLMAGADYGASPFDVGASIRDRVWPLVAVVLVGTVAWYGVRARSVRRHLAAAVGGVVMVLACYVVAGIAGDQYDEDRLAVDPARGSREERDRFGDVFEGFPALQALDGAAPHTVNVSGKPGPRAGQGSRSSGQAPRSSYTLSV